MITWTPGQRRAYALILVLVALDLLYSLACLFRIAQADRARTRRAQATADELMTRGPGEGADAARDEYLRDMDASP